MERVTALVAGVALALGVFGPASAQNDVMVIEFTAPDPSPVTTRVVVFVGDTACAEARFDAATPPAVILGAAGQPVSCHVDGAEVTFLQFRASNPAPGAPVAPYELSERTSFVAGSTFEFVNWAPAPPSDPAPPGGSLPAHMQAFVEGGATLLPAAMTIEFSNVADAGPIDRLIVFVNTAVCATADFGAGPRPPLILGHESQPAGCHTDGGSVTFLQIYRSGQTAQLFEETTLVPGGTYELANWAPQPPGTPLPDYMQAFLDAGAGVKPSAGGNLGLAASEGAPQVALLLLGTLVLLAASRRVTAGRPD